MQQRYFDRFRIERPCYLPIEGGRPVTPLLASTWFGHMSSKVTSSSEFPRPSEFVRVEAAALNELALRLDGTMLASFT